MRPIPGMGINTWEEAEKSGLVDKLKEAFPGRSSSTGPVLSAESVGFQPDAQPDGGRTYKHLAELAAPASACKF